MITAIILLIATVITMFICILSAHKAELWEEINEKSNSKK
jgi:hypothetical protein